MSQRLLAGVMALAGWVGAAYAQEPAVEGGAPAAQARTAPGEQMYVHPPSLAKMKRDLDAFISSTARAG